MNLYSNAASRAKTLLAHRHPEEYQALYAAILDDMREEEGLPPVARGANATTWDEDKYAEVTA